MSRIRGPLKPILRIIHPWARDDIHVREWHLACDTETPGQPWSTPVGGKE